MLLFTLRRAMSFTTRILKVRPESIQFVNDKPQISDNETLINLEIAAKELTTTHNAMGSQQKRCMDLLGLHYPMNQSNLYTKPKQTGR